MYQATVRPPRHSGERGSQWPAALELLFSEMPMVSVERNIITFSAAISVFPDKMLRGDWRLERIHLLLHTESTEIEISRSPCLLEQGHLLHSERSVIAA